MTTIRSVAILRVSDGVRGQNCPVKGCSFSAEDLDNIVTAHAATRDALFVPLKLTHDDDDKHGAAGWIENVIRLGDKLFADFVGVSDRAIELIREKRYRTRSVELHQDYRVGGRKFPLVLVGVALLGANLPAVDGLGDILLHRHVGEDDCRCPEEIKAAIKLGVTKAELEPTADEMWVAGQMNLSRESIMKQKARDRINELEGERQAMRFSEQFMRRYQ